MNPEEGHLFLNLIERNNLCLILLPHAHIARRNSKLNRIGLEAKEFIQCPHCRRVIKLDRADSEKKAMRVDHHFED
jgi:hypothetical protein